ncbi:hypothetical protein SAMN05660659_01232 [Pseudomonas sp. LAMO17WK12:I6]|nr:hypothetical protein [Pseudomonas sp. JAI115]SNY16207.1 hypothetical protein SAMN05660659_01232 [Pseudomonas sp. LAMO17WK12:I6]SNY19747.1 hypothetical protein SAMN05660455_01725 [Pseudomonas sp. LAMO17WK12:I5]
MADILAQSAGGCERLNISGRGLRIHCSNGDIGT